MSFSHKIVGKILGDKTSKNDAYPVMSPVSGTTQFDSNVIYDDVRRSEENRNKKTTKKKQMATLLKKK
jgi:hypothetical protein